MCYFGCVWGVECRVNVYQSCKDPQPQLLFPPLLTHTHTTTAKQGITGLTAHGHLPVPTPATLRLLLGVPTVPGPKGATGELVTPTGG